jgi:hypothetical protein
MDLRVGANKDLLAFRRGLLYILGQLQLETIEKYKFTWPWLIPASVPKAFHGFDHDRDGNPTVRPTVTLVSISSPNPKFFDNG